MSPSLLIDTLNRTKKQLYLQGSILRKDTSIMRLNDIIEELVHAIESKTKDVSLPGQE